MSCMKCPASMCPLIAANGSPWTGEYDSECPGHEDLEADGCPWWGMGCAGGEMMHVVDEAEVKEGRSLIIGPNKPRRQALMAPKSYDCPKESECRWQEQAKGLCPPREALARGLDPRICLF